MTDAVQTDKHVAHVLAKSLSGKATAAVAGWGESGLLLDIAAEIGDRGKVHAFGYLCELQVFLAEQPGDLVQGEAVYPVGGRLAAYLPAQFGEVVRAYTETRGIKADIPVPDVLPFIEQSNELPQQDSRPLRHLHRPVTAGMDIVQIQNVGCQKAAQQLVAEKMRDVRHALPKIEQGILTQTEVPGR